MSENNFVCGSCQTKFRDENTLAYCPSCGEMCEYEEPVEQYDQPPPYPPQTHHSPPPVLAKTQRRPPNPTLSLGGSSRNGPITPKETVDTLPEPKRPKIVPSGSVSPPPRMMPTGARNHPPPPPPYVDLAPALLGTQSALPRLSIPALKNAGSVKRKRSTSPPATSISPDPLSKFFWSTVSKQDKVLLIGEGNFSFAYALAKRLGTARNITASDVQMHHELIARNGCDQTIAPLLDMGATINCGTDVTKLSTTSPWAHAKGTYTVMSWAFPHTRTPNKDKNSVPEHRHLLRSFIDEAGVILEVGGHAIITVKEGYPYNSWDVAGLSTADVEYVKCEPFFPKDFPEYRHVTTVGAPIMQITPATTHVFKRVR